MPFVGVFVGTTSDMTADLTTSEERFFRKYRLFDRNRRGAARSFSPAPTVVISSGENINRLRGKRFWVFFFFFFNKSRLSVFSNSVPFYAYYWDAVLSIAAR